MTNRIVQMFGGPDITQEKADRIQQIHANYGGFAAFVASIVPPGPEQTVALRKLLESRDAATNGVAFPVEEPSRLVHPGGGTH